MDLIWIIYFIGMVETVSGCLGVIAALLFFACGMAAFLGMVEDEQSMITTAKRWIALPIIVAIIATFVPSKTTAYAMLAAHGTQVAATTELGRKAESALNKALDTYLAEE